MTQAIGPGSKVYLVDGSGYIFRAYHALPPLTRASDGLPVGAVAGFCNMLWKFLNDMKGAERPTHLAVIFDKSEETFRKELYPAYKAQRPPPPEDLIPQFGLIREATRAFGVPAIEMAGYEADDLIATYARQAAAQGAEVLIVSSDKDLMQLIEDGKIRLFDPMKQKPLGPAEVMEKFGVPPAQVIDVQALMGDSVDNVPGAPGIGQKTAAELISVYGSLETLLERAGEIKQPKRRETLIQYADQIRLSKALVTLKDDVAVEHALEAFAVTDFEDGVLLKFLDAMEFRTLSRRVREDMARDPQNVTPHPVNEPSAATIDFDAYETVTTLAALESWIARARAQGHIAIAAETDGLEPMRASLVGISLALRPNVACYVPVGHRRRGEGAGAQVDLFGPPGAPETGLPETGLPETGLPETSSPETGSPETGPPVIDPSGAPEAGRERALDPPPPTAAAEIFEQLALSAVLAALRPLLEDPTVLKIAHDVKSVVSVFQRLGVAIESYDCAMLISYALAGGLHDHDLDELSQRHLGHAPISLASVTGAGKGRISFAEAPVAVAARYCAEDADLALRLWALLKPRLAREGVLTVYETLERGLPTTLSAMEREGIRIDPNVLSRLSGDFAQRMAGFEAEAHRLAGRPFNIGSPKQLGDILFGEMKAPGGAKTKTGAWGTDASVLEGLTRDFPLARAVLDWRELAKLRSTYTEALREAVNPRTRRVHTRFSLAATTTGRLSSSDPNLQNIPIRTEEGRRLREAFVAEPGHVLISADYSQIELRLLAHVGDVPQLKRAFAEGLDIHAMTASEMFGVPIEGMDPMIRRQAKAINFGIIYGISAFGLANNLGIERGEADAYIKQYFLRFPGIREYMETTKAYARANGYVKTIFGRRCWVADIRSKTPAQRAFAERQAINAPLQGAASDIIRRAMLRLPPAIAAAGLQARMLLQVHDELVFEAPQAEAAATCALVKRVMERAAEPAVALSIPLTVEARAGETWAQAH